MNKMKETLPYQLTIELFEGMTCPGIPVTKDLTFNVEFSEEEVTLIRKLVKDYTGDKSAGLMPILEDAAHDLYVRISDKALDIIYDYFLVEGFKEGYFELDTDEQRKFFKKDMESGEFKPEEFIEDSMWFEEMPEDEEELMDLWEEWECSKATVENATWLKERYPNILEQLDVSEEQDYICQIPDEFVA